tara:strand:+ start:243 stop:767 length:525 start_codon:yes stop_codon:yes gene_type:complete
MFSIFKKIISFLFTVCIIFATDETSKTIPNLKIRMLDGSKTTIHQLVEEGPLMIDFWATWCVPCKKVMKFLDDFHQEFEPDGFKVLMINTDTPRSVGKVKSYVRAQDYQFLVGMDPNKTISKKLNGMVMPTLILVDKGGEIKWRHQGYLPGEEVEIKNQIEMLINRSKENAIEG